MPRVRGGGGEEEGCTNTPPVWWEGSSLCRFGLFSAWNPKILSVLLMGRRFSSPTRYTHAHTHTHVHEWIEMHSSSRHERGAGGDEETAHSSFVPAFCCTQGYSRQGRARLVWCVSARDGQTPTPTCLKQTHEVLARQQPVFFDWVRVRYRKHHEHEEVQVQQQKVDLRRRGGGGVCTGAAVEGNCERQCVRSTIGCPIRLWGKGRWGRGFAGRQVLFWEGKTHSCTDLTFLALLSRSSQPTMRRCHVQGREVDLKRACVASHAQVKRRLSLPAHSATSLRQKLQHFVVTSACVVLFDIKIAASVQQEFGH